MAIRINNKNARLGEKYGRITMPRGTYFSNPSTAGVGSLGAGAGSNPGGGTPEGFVTSALLSPAFRQAQTYATFGLGGGNLFSNIYSAVTNPAFRPGQTTAMLGMGVNPGMFQGALRTGVGYGTPDMGVYNRFTAFGALGNPAYRDATARELWEMTAGIFRGRSQGTNIFENTNQTVGQNFGDYPAMIRLDTMRHILPTASWDKQNALLMSKGYQWIPYNGGFWAKTGQPTGQSPDVVSPTAQTDTRGRQVVNPFELGPTLAPGERAVVSGGYGVTGGTPTATGEAQYAITMPGEGDRWKFKIAKDSAGNWARIYYRTDGRVNKRSWQNRQRRRQEQGQGSESSPREVNQLVTLRANFG